MVLVLAKDMVVLVKEYKDGMFSKTFHIINSQSLVKIHVTR